MPAVQVELVLLFVTLLIVLISYIKRRNTAQGLCLGYGLSVFVSEFMYERIGTVTVMGLTVIQIIAIVLIATGAVYIRKLYDDIK